MYLITIKEIGSDADHFTHSIDTPTYYPVLQESKHYLFVLSMYFYRLQVFEQVLLYESL